MPPTKKTFLKQKMKIFQIIQRQYAMLGISLLHQSTQMYPFDRPRVLSGFLIFGSSLGSQFVHIFHEVANGYMEYMVCICDDTAVLITLACFVTIVFKSDLLFENILKLENVIDTRCEYSKAEKLFSKTNRQVERLSEMIFTIVMKIALQCYMIPSCLVSFATYINTNKRNDSFELPFPMWLPFDASNPIRYLIAFIVEYIIFGYGCFISCCILSVGFGAFWFAISVIKEIHRILHLFNDEIQADANQSNEMKTLLLEYIDAHWNLMQVERDFSDIFQPIIMLFFTWSLFAISGALVAVQFEILHHGNIMPLMELFVGGIIALTCVFIACELGQRMSDAFGGINDTIIQFDWYLLPIEIKRMLPMIIAIVQQPVELECFGSIACSRDTFKNIIHRAYSYFMVLRKIVD